MGNTVCVLADAVAMPVIGFVNKFRAEFEEHLRFGTAPSPCNRPPCCRGGARRSALMPTLEIDGKSVTVEDGLNVIQAAERLGIEIPHYCYHPALTISGNCRMCLVEIEKAPKLQIACNTRVNEGMVVRTQNERVKTARAAVLEFLLLNHPIDCPICDQAGECKLQDYYMDYDRQPSRFQLEDKVKKEKAVDIGPLIMLDRERCILCSRCTRFLEEVTHTEELGIFQRGNHCQIDLFPGKRLENHYSGNVADICPVGALTNKDFRFRARVGTSITAVDLQPAQPAATSTSTIAAAKCFASVRATMPTSISTDVR
jgi:predicted molibdopterin-dependent oxidoreductase YjgC